MNQVPQTLTVLFTSLGLAAVGEGAAFGGPTALMADDEIRRRERRY